MQHVGSVRAMLHNRGATRYPRQKSKKNWRKHNGKMTGTCATSSSVYPTLETSETGWPWRISVD